MASFYNPSWLFQGLSYVRFLWHSKNEHGVHSPFVFSLLTQCLYDRKPKAAYTLLQNYRKGLLQQKGSIAVTDLGAGSKVFKSNTRPIAAIAKTAGSTQKRTQMLYRLTQYFQPETILELGTSLGLSTAAMSLGNPKARLITLEGCANTQAVARAQWDQHDLASIAFIPDEFSNYLRQLDAQKTSFDMIYFDGNHSKEATLTYFEQLLPTAQEHSVWIFDDIHWSAEMEAAWTAIQNHPRVRVTIDTFQWGLVFFRTTQAKEHFILRT